MSKRVFFLLISMGLIPASAIAQVQPVDLFLPHFAVGEGWETIVKLQMTGSFCVIPPGGPSRPCYLTVRFNDQNNVNVQTFKVTTPGGVDQRAQATHVFKLDTTSNKLTTGHVHISGEGSVYGLMATVTFRNTITKQLASYTDDSSGYRSVMPWIFDHREDTTGMAIFNPSAYLPATLTIRWLNSQGEGIVNRTITLLPKQQMSMAVAMPELAGKYGTMTISPADGLSAELRQAAERVKVLVMTFTPWGAFSNAR